MAFYYIDAGVGMSHRAFGPFKTMQEGEEFLLSQPLTGEQKFIIVPDTGRGEVVVAEVSQRELKGKKNPSGGGGPQ